MYLCLFSEIHLNSYSIVMEWFTLQFTYPALKRVRFLKTVDDIDNIPTNTNYKHTDFFYKSTYCMWYTTVSAILMLYKYNYYIKIENVFFLNYLTIVLNTFSVIYTFFVIDMQVYCLTILRQE